MEYKDYYDILGVDKDASQDEIKSSYRKLAKKYHPDLNPDDQVAEAKFKEVTEAYEVLSDENKKAQYDAFGSSTNFSGGQNFNPNDFGFTYSTSGGSGFSDFFDTFFGGASRETTSSSVFDFSDIFSRRQAPRPEYSFKLNISLEEAYNGASKNLSVNIGGRNVNMDVKVPKGITPGKKLRVKGEKWDIEGDILFDINIKESKYEYLEGLNIIKKVELYPWEAYFGVEKIVNPISGKIKIKAPENTQTGQRLRVKDRGFEDLKSNKGHLYLEFVIQNPKNLDQDQEELYQKLQESFD